MLEICGNRSQKAECFSRRDFLQAGVLGAAGLALPERLNSRIAEASSPPRQDTAVILIWQGGGPSHLDTWDMKPEAPAEFRGEFKPIATCVPGIDVCEHLPLSAQQMDRFSIVRSLTHADAGHESASHLLLTGHRASSDLPTNEMPSLGSVVARQLGSRRPGLPAYVAVPQAPRSSHAAHLGTAYDPVSLDHDPNDDDVSLTKRMLPDGRARHAFAIDREPVAVRERYGRTRLGQSLLMARRLIEAGVRFVTVDDGGWDTHAQNFAMLEKKLPEFDQAWSALLVDLAQRGMLDDTLVLVWGEFGRSPRINDHAGRDHWPGVMSALLAGGGLKMGQVIGQSDAQGDYPNERPISPEDVLSTVYRVLGIDQDTDYHGNNEQQSLKILARGRPIEELVG